MTFLRELLAVILGVFISFFIMFFVFLAIGSAISSSFMDEDMVRVSDNSVLVLKLEDQIRDFAPKSDDPLEQLLGLDQEVMGLNTIINAIDNAKYDKKIRGISIESLSLRAGIGQLQEIRDKLHEFKESGKFIMAYADVYDQKNYYMSSVADSIYVNPVGFLDIKGLSGEILYFKDFQDKYGVRMEVIRHGKYKSAVEPFLESEMSEANREQTVSFLNSVWGELVDDISENRGLTPAQINSIADDLAARSPDLALEHGMISGQVYRDGYRNILKGLVEIGEEDELNMVSVKDYIKSGKGRIVSTAKDRIAVVYAQGEIIYGKGDERFIGQDLIIKSLRKAKEAKDIKAIVLRVNSPGGSALASDIIWREIEMTKQEKPVIVSMGSYATSGGYYISCNANRIVAEPTSITGSIGVFGIIPNISEFADRIGINAEQIGTNRQSVGYSIFEPMPEDFYAVTKEGVERVYETFVSKVAQGRNMTFEQVDSIAQGRVWTGKEALDKGLVDELGSLDDAVRVAADMAGITEYRIRNYPDYEKEFKDLFKGPFSRVKQNLIREELGESTYEALKKVRGINDLKGIQARLPFMLEIH
jgi:protease-4